MMKDLLRNSKTILSIVGGIVVGSGSIAFLLKLAYELGKRSTMSENKAEINKARQEEEAAKKDAEAAGNLVQTAQVLDEKIRALYDEVATLKEKNDQREQQYHNLIEQINSERCTNRQRENDVDARVNELEVAVRNWGVFPIDQFDRVLNVVPIPQRGALLDRR